MTEDKAVLSPRATEVVATARQLLEEDGPSALSMRNVAGRLGIRAPSLYEHLPDKRALEDAIIAGGLLDQGAYEMEQIRGARDPLRALVLGYRQWARDHPHLYLLMTARELDRSQPGVAAAEEEAARPVREVTGDNPTAGALMWAWGHGMVVLELNGRFPPRHDLDALWEQGIEMLRPLLA
jgi:AcrR family transcriptional regulator